MNRIEFKQILDNEIKAIFDTLIYYENGGYHTLRVCQMGYEINPPVTEDDKIKSDNINKEIEQNLEYQNLLRGLKKQVELTKEMLIKVEEHFNNKNI